MKVIHHFVCQVAKGFHGVPDEVLKQAEGYTAVCLFVNKKISDGQVLYEFITWYVR